MATTTDQRTAYRQVEAALKPSDVAALQGVNVRKVWDWIESGRLAAENNNPGGKRPTWRVRPEEYRRFRDSLLNVKPADTRRRAPREAAAAEVFDFIG